MCFSSVAFYIISGSPAGCSQQSCYRYEWGGIRDVSYFKYLKHTYNVQLPLANMSIQLKVSHDRLRSFDGSILKLGRQLVDSPIAVGLQLKAPVNTISDTSVAEAGRGEFPSMLENRAPNSSPRFPWSCTNLRKRATIKVRQPPLSYEV